MTEHYSGRRVIVTGGLGFIGSNLVLRLVELGAEVTVIDGLIHGCGGNEWNLDTVRARITVIRADLLHSEMYEPALAGVDFVFNLAGEISHIQSMRDPERDLRLNALSQLRFLTTLARVKPGAQVIYAGTRQVCGRPRYLPVDEEHPIEPVDFNGIHKRAAEHYHLLMSRDGMIDATVVRLTNVYGPRLALGVPGQGFIPAFLARALNGQGLEVYGDGRQLRDPVYVDDVVEAFLRIGVLTRREPRLYHLGGPAALSLHEIARLISRAAGLGGEVSLRPFPAEHLKFDIGSYTTNSARLREALGWQPRVSFAEGIQRTIEFFLQHRQHYLRAPARDPVPAA